MACCLAGKTLASTGELTGTESPSLMTIGRDGAVFFWVYEPVPFPVYQHPKRFGNIPGKRRKRKAPDTDLEEPEQQGSEDADKAANSAEACDSESDSDKSSSKEADPSKEGTDADSSSASSDSEPAGGATAEDVILQHQKAIETEQAHVSTAVEGSVRSSNGEADRQQQASTSDRSEGGSPQSTSYAGPTPPETAATYMSYFCAPV